MSMSKDSSSKYHHIIMSIFFNWQQSTDWCYSSFWAHRRLLCFGTSFVFRVLVGKSFSAHKLRILQFEFIPNKSSTCSACNVLNETCTEFRKMQNCSHPFEEFSTDFSGMYNSKIYDLTTRCGKIALGVSLIKAKSVFLVDAHKNTCQVCTWIFMTVKDVKDHIKAIHEFTAEIHKKGKILSTGVVNTIFSFLP